MVIKKAKQKIEPVKVSDAGLPPSYPSYGFAERYLKWVADNAVETDKSDTREYDSNSDDDDVENDLPELSAARRRMNMEPDGTQTLEDGYTNEFFDIKHSIADLFVELTQRPDVVRCMTFRVLELFALELQKKELQIKRSYEQEAKLQSARPSKQFSFRSVMSYKTEASPRSRQGVQSVILPKRSPLLGNFTEVSPRNRSFAKPSAEDVEEIQGVLSVHGADATSVDGSQEADEEDKILAEFVASKDGSTPVDTFVSHLHGAFDAYKTSLEDVVSLFDRVIGGATADVEAGQDPQFSLVDFYRGCSYCLNKCKRKISSFMNISDVLGEVTAALTEIHLKDKTIASLKEEILGQNEETIRLVREVVRNAVCQKKTTLLSDPRRAVPSGSPTVSLVGVEIYEWAKMKGGFQGIEVEAIRGTFKTTVSTTAEQFDAVKSRSCDGGVTYALTEAHTALLFAEALFTAFRNPDIWPETLSAHPLGETTKDNVLTGLRTKIAVSTGKSSVLIHDTGAIEYPGRVSDRLPYLMTIIPPGALFLAGEALEGLEAHGDLTSTSSGWTVDLHGTTYAVNDFASLPFFNPKEDGTDELNIKSCIPCGIDSVIHEIWAELHGQALSNDYLRVRFDTALRTKRASLTDSPYFAIDTKEVVPEKPPTTSIHDIQYASEGSTTAYFVLVDIGSFNTIRFSLSEVLLSRLLHLLQEKCRDSCESFLGVPCKPCPERMREYPLREEDISFLYVCGFDEVHKAVAFSQDIQNLCFLEKSWPADLEDLECSADIWHHGSLLFRGLRPTVVITRGVVTKKKRGLDLCTTTLHDMMCIAEFALPGQTVITPEVFEALTDLRHIKQTAEGVSGNVELSTEAIQPDGELSATYSFVVTPLQTLFMKKEVEDDDKKNIETYESPFRCIQLAKFAAREAHFVSEHRRVLKRNGSPRSPSNAAISAGINEALQKKVDNFYLSLKNFFPPETPREGDDAMDALLRAKQLLAGRRGSDGPAIELLTRELKEAETTLEERDAKIEELEDELYCMKVAQNQKIVVEEVPPSTSDTADTALKCDSLLLRRAHEAVRKFSSLIQSYLFTNNFPFVDHWVDLSAEQKLDLMQARQEIQKQYDVKAHRLPIGADAAGSRLAEELALALEELATTERKLKVDRFVETTRSHCIENPEDEYTASLSAPESIVLSVTGILGKLWVCIQAWFASGEERGQTQQNATEIFHCLQSIACGKLARTYEDMGCNTTLTLVGSLNPNEKYTPEGHNIGMGCDLALMGEGRNSSRPGTGNDGGFVASMMLQNKSYSRAVADVVVDANIWKGDTIEGTTFTYLTNVSAEDDLHHEPPETNEIKTEPDPAPLPSPKRIKRGKIVKGLPTKQPFPSGVLYPHSNDKRPGTAVAAIPKDSGDLVGLYRRGHVNGVRVESGEVPLLPCRAALRGQVHTADVQRYLDDPVSPRSSQLIEYRADLAVVRNVAGAAFNSRYEIDDVIGGTSGSVPLLEDKMKSLGGSDASLLELPAAVRVPMILPFPSHKEHRERVKPLSPQPNTNTGVGALNRWDGINDKTSDMYPFSLKEFPVRCGSGLRVREKRGSGKGKEAVQEGSGGGGGDGVGVVPPLTFAESVRRKRKPFVRISLKGEVVK